ncbi:MAG TPA: aldo/keto reductase [Candidatus Binataceae bacterium]|nr:aldo/keto reductase [Candidatus Binataceae bacterium]
MERAILGKTALEVSRLGFGCGAVGGLMVRGEARAQIRAIERALELGVTYFDTAPLYGNGESEKNLGRALATLKAEVLVGTKVRLRGVDLARIPQAITASLEASLKRLGREQVDLLQLHNAIGEAELSVEQVLGEVLPAMERLRTQGKTRFCGITATGESAALHQVIDSGAIDTAQVVFNLLNPSAGREMKVAAPARNYRNLLAHASRAGVGTINIRVLAGGALAGTTQRHPLGSPSVEPIGTGADYRADVEQAARLMSLVEEGLTDSLIEASLRLAVAQREIATILVGYSTLEQLEYAAACVAKGPLPPAALERLAALSGWTQA